MLIKIKNIDLSYNVFKVIHEEDGFYFIEFDNLPLKIEKKRCKIILKLE